MNWLAVLKGLFSLTNWIAQYMAEKQLIDAGVSKEIAKNNAQALEKISLAQRARDSVNPDDDIKKDPNNRDV